MTPTCHARVYRPAPWVWKVVVRTKDNIRAVQFHTWEPAIECAIRLVGLDPPQAGVR